MSIGHKLTSRGGGKAVRTASTSKMRFIVAWMQRSEIQVSNQSQIQVESPVICNRMKNEDLDMKAKLFLTLILSTLCLTGATVAHADNCPPGVVCIIICPGDSCSGN